MDGLMHPDDLHEIMDLLRRMAEALERSAAAHDRQNEALMAIYNALQRLAGIEASLDQIHGRMDDI